MGPPLVLPFCWSNWDLKFEGPVCGDIHIGRREVSFSQGVLREKTRSSKKRKIRIDFGGSMI